MSENTETVIEQVPVIETPVLEEKIYSFQPTDENGRAIGGKQVIKYHTHEELADKLQEQNTLLIRKLRSETRKNRLGIVENENISEDAERYAGPIEFKPRDLTTEERYDISRRLLDPTTAFDATSELFEAAIGAPLNTLSKTVQDLQRDNINYRAKMEADAFRNDNPDYYLCQENSDAILSWIIRYDLAPVKANFQRAYDTLKSQGIILQAPEKTLPVQETIPVLETLPVLETIPPVPEKVVPINAPRIPSGLTRDNTSDSGTPPPAGSDIVYEVITGGQKRVFTGMAALNAMPGDEYKLRLLRDPNFSKKVDKLEAEARKPRS
jgi:hypothetical protein